jgi:NTP pyrophosphatase (non-canonical NTP hydrolase)
MSKDDTSTTIQQLKDVVARFQAERGWEQHNTPRNLAISISIEAAELLEHFQWGEYSPQDRQKIAHELADILIYCFNFAHTFELDIATIFTEKLQLAAEKYPVELFNGQRDSRDDYHRVKQTYRQGKGKQAQ